MIVSTVDIVGSLNGGRGFVRVRRVAGCREGLPRCGNLKVGIFVIAPGEHAMITIADYTTPSESDFRSIETEVRGSSWDHDMYCAMGVEGRAIYGPEDVLAPED